MIESKPINYEEIDQQLITIAFFGYVSVGKTLLVNSMLSEFLGIKKEVLIAKHFENTNSFLEIVSMPNYEFKMALKREN